MGMYMYIANISRWTMPPRAYKVKTPPLPETGHLQAFDVVQRRQVKYWVCR